ncbi:hypothetical protein [Mesorhizobium sp.]|uniref:hypothetical protein n=1 Tax=Mesorhizobium sp. TaxID=1871066 RepID=UPI000FE8BF9C|nr:hypothetical protein [Mesorhizobium sp.]RWP69520.1 MAG: hypothetical protein EOR07_03065 [Mesorhizobium sp.]
MRNVIETALDFANEMKAIFIGLGLLVWAIVSPLGFAKAALLALAWVIGNLGLVLILLVAALIVIVAVLYVAERNAI